MKKLIVLQLIIALLSGFFINSANTVNAADPLTISDINITYTDQNATITWRTNRPATGRIQYGLYTNDYNWTLNTNQKISDQAITIFGLYPETTYYFKITAIDDFSEVASFEQNFKTKDASDNKSPVISSVVVAETTGTTATIQWLTDESANSEVEYGMSENYGQTKNDGRRVKIHDITITGLTDYTFYHFRVKSTDKDGNTARWYDMTFRTNLTDRVDKDSLIIYNVSPAAVNDVNVTQTSAVISWRTNKLAEGWVRYGQNSNYGKTIASNSPRNYTHSITLINLVPGTAYYFEIEAKDVFNKRTKSQGYSFTTDSIDPVGPVGPVGGNQPYQNSGGQILGAGTCDVNLQTDFGYYGLYYNLTPAHPDMQIDISNSTWAKVGRENDWYDSKYFSFNRIDGNLQFGSRFFPLNENLPGDPNHFAINWRGIINVPQDGSYTYFVASDDDSWTLIDDQLTSSLDGLHAVKKEDKTIQLSAGYHKLEIYYADRRGAGADFSFKPDSRLKISPLPEGCSVQDVLNYNNILTGGRNQGQSAKSHRLDGVGHDGQHTLLVGWSC